MGTVSRLIIGGAVVVILGSIITDPAGLITDTIRLVGQYSGVDVTPVLHFYHSIDYKPAVEFVGRLGALVRDFIQILADHTKAPDSFVGSNNTTATATLGNTTATPTTTTTATATNTTA